MDGSTATLLLLCVSIDISHCFLFPFHTKRSKQTAVLQSRGLLQVSSPWGVFPAHCCLLLLWRDQLVFSPIVQRALRRLWMWFSTGKYPFLSVGAGALTVWQNQLVTFNCELPSSPERTPFSTPWSLAALSCSVAVRNSQTQFKWDRNPKIIIFVDLEKAFSGLLFYNGTAGIRLPCLTKGRTTKIFEINVFTFFVLNIVPFFSFLFLFFFPLGLLVFKWLMKCWWNLVNCLCSLSCLSHSNGGQEWLK